MANKETKLVCDGKDCGSDQWNIIQIHDPHEESHENDQYRLYCAVCGLPIECELIGVKLMSEYNVEMTYRTTVKGVDKDDAKKNARAEMTKFPFKADATYCELV